MELTNSENNELADILFPEVDLDIDFFLNQYPKRNLSAEEKVTRFAPSPTGFVHIGGLFTALVAERIAHENNGVFFLRIEDTDKKREVENGVTDIIKVLNKFGIRIDEGPAISLTDVGVYGPYIQSKRLEIYKTFTKYLINKGVAYPCFCSSEELEVIRKEQELLKIRPGYYGKWAKHRTLGINEIKDFLNADKEFVIRLKSDGDEVNKNKFDDLIKGEVSITENNNDVVLLKSDGFPTYHLAHVIDDHLMGTTDIIRADEWLSSLPIHLEIFNKFGWKAPRYGHLSPMLKIDNGNKRKLSKRKDPESSVDFYYKEGYPLMAIKEYLLNIANSNFEDWRKENPEKEIIEFKLKLTKFNKSGALFDLDKLKNISLNIISKMKAEEIYRDVVEWAGEYNKGFFEELTKNQEYFINIFNIERNTGKPRKDIAKWSEVKDNTEYFFRDFFAKELNFAQVLSTGTISRQSAIDFLSKYLNKFSTSSNKDEWFDFLKNIAEEAGFSRDMKDYKSDPSKYKGSISDAAMLLRVALTTKSKTPDLYEMINVLGQEEVVYRLNYSINSLEGG